MWDKTGEFMGQSERTKHGGAALSAEKSLVWEAEAKRILKAELARRGLTYKALAARLEAVGVRDEERAIANRISRGKFQFTFFLQCMRAMGVEHVDVRDRSRES